MDIEITTFSSPNIVITKQSQNIQVDLVAETTPPEISITGVVVGPQGEDSVSDQDIIDVIQENDPLGTLANLTTLYNVAKL